MNNKQNGNKFEREFSEILSKQGFWVYVMPTKQGQPADIVAGKDGKIYLYDCKNCQGDKFVLSRIEENQIDAAELFERCGCDNYFFAIKVANCVYIVSYLSIKLWCGCDKSVDADGLARISRVVYEIS